VCLLDAKEDHGINVFFHETGVNYAVVDLDVGEKLRSTSSVADGWIRVRE